jgi:hypothetical protein
VTTIAPDLLKRLRSKVKEHPEFLETLEFLAREPMQEDSGEQPDPELLALARRINAERAREDDDDFVAHSLTAEQVAQRIGVTSRQAVAQRRARGSLLGAEVRGKVRYPEWQFTSTGVVPDLPELFVLLEQHGVRNARVADSVLRMPHTRLDGGALVDVWRKGDWPLLRAWFADIGMLSS